MDFRNPNELDQVDRTLYDRMVKHISAVGIEKSMDHYRTHFPEATDKDIAQVQTHMLENAMRPAAKDLGATISDLSNSVQNLSQSFQGLRKQLDRHTYSRKRKS